MRNLLISDVVRRARRSDLRDERPHGRKLRSVSLAWISSLGDKDPTPAGLIGSALQVMAVGRSRSCQSMAPTGQLPRAKPCRL